MGKGVLIKMNMLYKFWIYKINSAKTGLLFLHQINNEEFMFKVVLASRFGMYFVGETIDSSRQMFEYYERGNLAVYI